MHTQRIGGTGLTGPAVRLLLHHYQLDSIKVKASGPKKNILKSDVISYIAQNNLSPRLARQSHHQEMIIQENKVIVSKQTGKSQKYTDIPLSNTRQLSAKRIAFSKATIPHAYMSTDISANNLISLTDQFLKDGLKISLNDIVIKATSLALRTVPQINVNWNDGDVISLPSINISVAIPIPTTNEVATPILFNADRLSIKQISEQLRNLPSLSNEDDPEHNNVIGSSFTVYNLGTFGISHFTAIINFPQVAVLSVGGLDLDPQLGNKSEVERQFTITLCYDSRAIDDLSAQQFLQHLRILLVKPETMLSGTEKFVDISNLL